MSELTDKLRREATQLRKVASSQDAYTHAVLQDLYSGLGFDKEAAAALNTYDLMEKVKAALSSRSVSSSMEMELDRIRTPAQLVDYLDGAEFQLRKTAADTSKEASDSKDDSSESEAKKKTKEHAIQKLVENGMKREDAEEKVDREMNKSKEDN